MSKHIYVLRIEFGRAWHRQTNRLLRYSKTKVDEILD